MFRLCEHYTIKIKLVAVVAVNWNVFEVVKKINDVKSKSITSTFFFLLK